MMFNEILGTALQLILFSLIPFIFYWIRKKQIKGFFIDIGLKKSPWKANLLGLLASLVFSVPLLIVLTTHPEFKSVMLDETSMTGKIRAMGFSMSSLFLVFLLAIFKTALAEEILFRGFLAKQFIVWLGFIPGNIIQAVIFGLIHTLLFISVTKNPIFLLIIFLAPASGAFVSVYLNEKLASGSIIPGWISHAAANVMAYSIIGFNLIPF